MNHKLITVVDKNKKEDMLSSLRLEKLSLAEAFRKYPDEILWDDIFGIRTAKELFPSRYFGPSSFSYDPTPRLMQGYLLEHISFSAQDTLMEVGGGTGSVAISFATQKMHKVISVDIDPLLTETARINYLNARRSLGKKDVPALQINSMIDFINCNALKLSDKTLDQVTKFYIARPFDKGYTEIFIYMIHNSFHRAPRRIEIITYGWPSSFIDIFKSYYNNHWFQPEQAIKIGEMETTVWTHRLLS